MGEHSDTPEDRRSDRWTRRVSKGDAVSSNELRLSDSEAARIAERASRMADNGVAPRVSIRPNDENPSLKSLSMDAPETQTQPTVASQPTVTSQPIVTSQPTVTSAPLNAELDGSLGSLPPLVAPATPETMAPPIDNETIMLDEDQTQVIDLRDSADADADGNETPAAAVTTSSIRFADSVDSGPSSSTAPSGPSTFPPSPDKGSPGVVDVSSPFTPVRPKIGGAALEPVPRGLLPVPVDPPPPVVRRNTAGLLLVVAAALAVLSGVLGALWMRQRSTTEDLQAQVERAEAMDDVSSQGLEELGREVRTLEADNDRLAEQLNDMSALVLELPEGRLAEIDVPFTPTLADEENGRLIAISATGEYVTFGEGSEGAITDAGTLSGAPTGLFAATRKAWIATDAGEVEVLSLVADEPGLDTVDVGPTAFLAPEERGYWTFNQSTGEVVRRKKSDGEITAAAEVPVDVVDLTIGAGSVWALGEDGRVYRINTADLTVSPLDAGVDLVSVTAGPDALWTLSAADGSLRRVDPVSGEVLVTVPVGRDPIDAVFAGRSVWVVLRTGSSLIEVDTSTAAVVSRTPLPGEPTALHQGDSGVYVTTTSEESPLVFVASLIPFEPVDDTGAEAGSSAEDGAGTEDGTGETGEG